MPRGRFTHGHAGRKVKHPLYATWSGMKQRCSDPNHIEYERYASRGITVCERWRLSFVAFLEDVGLKPSPRHSIERIDNAKGYEPGNVRWATSFEQMRNTRLNHLIEFNGRTQCLQAWAEEIGIEASLIRYRLKHWDVERALTTPVRRCRRENSKGQAEGVQVLSRGVSSRSRSKGVRGHSKNRK